MATTSKRALWKGAISFGLVHIPIALHSATADQGLDFDWLDKRSMDPVGYKRINKKTGKEIAKEDIVKGIEYEDGQYVVLSPEEIQAAYPKTTQTVEIEAFVPLSDIPFIYLERPYYISPINRGSKVYALLREVLRKTRKVGIAKVVIQTKQHLAVLMPCGPALILNLLRWGDEIRSWDELNLPAEGAKAAGLTEKELAMGEQLVKDMSAKWKPEAFTDSFKDQILQLVKEKIEAGETESVSQPEAEESETAGAKIYDLTEMLQRSLNKGSRTGASQNAPAETSATKKSAASTSAKSAAKRSPAATVKKSKTAAAKTSPSKPAKSSSGDKNTGKPAHARKTGKSPSPAGRKAA
ncbi:Ku protein [Candidimonas sp. SYP-B2681]|uniref:non-homologous end joining protein Ku n=1 Tax=Candidimonas sp. SYP-B2681 TaxID=2497686 RepID=UPI001F234F93|nr:Ku protein [Candidimonas sp. SYP-B2681]